MIMPQNRSERVHLGSVLVRSNEERLQQETEDSLNKPGFLDFGMFSALSLMPKGVERTVEILWHFIWEF